VRPVLPRSAEPIWTSVKFTSDRPAQFRALAVSRAAHLLSDGDLGFVPRRRVAETGSGFLVCLP